MFQEDGQETREHVESESRRFATGKSSLFTSFTDSPLEDEVDALNGRASLELPDFVSNFYEEARRQIDPESHEL